MRISTLGPLPHGPRQPQVVTVTGVLALALLLLLLTNVSTSAFASTAPSVRQSRSWHMRISVPAAGIADAFLLLVFVDGMEDSALVVLIWLLVRNMSSSNNMLLVKPEWLESVVIEGMSDYLID